MTFESEEARRAFFLERLREKLGDPEFRKTPGFPVAADEDILRLSDPPYYTACPNPFLEEFIAHHARAFDPSEKYQCAPLAVDVSEGKSDPVYGAHSYHTKVPPRAIRRYIEHFTKPGDLILDGFCGTGMTGVAVQQSEAGRPEVGAPGAKRHAVLCDLTPLATFIAHNLLAPVDVSSVEQHHLELLRRAEERFGSLFETTTPNGASATLHYAVWSDVFVCSECSAEFSYWDAAVDLDSGVQVDPFPCPSCRSELRKRTVERAYTTRLDPITGATARLPKRKPVLLNYESSDGRGTKAPSEEDLQLATDLEGRAPDHWCPSQPLPRADRYYKDGLHLVGLDYYHRFYFSRTLHVLAFLWQEIDALQVGKVVRNRLRFILTSMLDRNLTIRNRFVINRHNPKGRINGPLANTLYVPGLSVEQNPLEALRYKSADVCRAAHRLPQTALVTTQDAAALPDLENCFDYVFIDPPFGHNIMYSELNGVTESWLRVSADAKPEAVVSEAQGKPIERYMSLMESCFARFQKLLKPGRWMTVEFHNSQNSVWNAIQEALLRAGFVIADVRTLDKKKGTINQEYYSAGAVKTDLVISAYKPSDDLSRRWTLVAGSEEGVWEFVREHLAQVPSCVLVGDSLEIVAERQSHMLFDRMVAFHVQSSVSVPISAGDFYKGLEKRFPERDGMYFLPEQVGEYDRNRAKTRELKQLTLFVNDEASAIQWIRQALQKKPQTFQELQPRFMQELKAWAKHEQTLELREILQDNFLSYEGEDPVPPQIHSYLSTNFKELRKLEKTDRALVEKAKGRWYVPDPAKQGDLDQIRSKRLLAEFEEYRTAKIKKLKQFRTEAIRAGFSAAWNAKDFQAIVDVAKKIPDSVLQEDPDLLMYYDNASTLLGTD